MTEYLKKSDVMAKFYYSPVALADISTLPTHTFPDPSDAVDGDLISRKALLERLNMPFLKYMQTKANGRRLIYLDEVHEVITEMPLPPAPSVAAPESDTSKLLEMIDDLERAYAANQPIRARLIAMLREIARLLAERGDK